MYLLKYHRVGFHYNNITQCCIQYNYDKERLVLQLMKAHRPVNPLRPRQNGHRFADDIFKRIFLNENVKISIKISLKFVPKGPINNNPALVQIIAWRQPGDKPLSESMLVRLPTHICVTRPQWVKRVSLGGIWKMNYAITGLQFYKDRIHQSWIS